jgi:hypothetical protein
MAYPRSPIHVEADGENENGGGAVVIGLSERMCVSINGNVFNGFINFVFFI